MYSLRELFVIAKQGFLYGTQDQAIILEGHMRCVAATPLSVEAYTRFLLSHCLSRGDSFPTQSTYASQNFWNVNNKDERLDLRGINAVPMQLAVDDSVFLRLPKSLDQSNIIEYNQAGVARFIGMPALIYRECDNILNGLGYSEAFGVLQEWRGLQSISVVVDKLDDSVALRQKAQEFSEAVRSDTHALKYKKHLARCDAVPSVA